MIEMKGLEFAIQMELDGEKYYLQQAELNQDNGLKTVFLMLAQDEKKHAEVLKSRFAKSEYALEENEKLNNISSIFDGIGDYREAIKAKPAQLDLYRAALDNEQQSIDLYKKGLEEASEPEEKALYEFLVKEETSHYQIIEEIIQYIKRTDDWVESAEFGKREEY
jgi:rubrerythrin